MANWNTPARRAVWEASRKDRVCSIDSCDERHYAKGLCEPHWKHAHKYGLTDAQMEPLGGNCQICGAYQDPIYVDHDHSDGGVRGRLCARCNGLLGYARDDQALLLAASEYLGTYTSRAVA